MTDEKSEKLRQLFEMGEPYEDIAKELDISKSTVIRAVKKLHDGSHEARELNKKSKSYLSKSITRKDLKNQDETEGWVVDIRLLKEIDKQSSCYFTGVFYPETMELGKFIEACERRGLKVSISPLHNKDKWLHDSPAVVDTETGEVIFAEGERYEIGDPKKEHYHYIIQFATKQSFEFMYELHKVLANNNVIPKIVYSPLGMFEYLWHKNEDMSLKAHYNRDEVTIINGFNPLLTTSDKELILKEIILKIRENHFTRQKDVEEFFNYSTEVITVMGVKNYYINNVLQEEWRMKNPDYAKKIRIVEGDN